MPKGNSFLHYCLKLVEKGCFESVLLWAGHPISRRSPGWRLALTRALPMTSGWRVKSCIIFCLNVPTFITQQRLGYSESSRMILKHHKKSIELPWTSELILQYFMTKQHPEEDSNKDE